MYWGVTLKLLILSESGSNKASKPITPEIGQKMKILDVWSFNDNSVKPAPLLDVLIDPTGDREEFLVGWYDEYSKVWLTYSDDRQYLIDPKRLKWCYLPLKELDKL